MNDIDVFGFVFVILLVSVIGLIATLCGWLYERSESKKPKQKKIFY